MADLKGVLRDRVNTWKAGNRALVDLLRDLVLTVEAHGHRIELLEEALRDEDGDFPPSDPSGEEESQ